LSPQFRTYVLAIIATSFVAVVTVSQQFPILDRSGVLVLCAVAAVIGSMEFELPLAASVSLGFATTFAGIVYAGPMGGAVVGALGSVSVAEIRGHKPMLLMLGNAAQLALSATVAGICYVSFGGVPLQAGAVMTMEFPVSILAPLGATAAFFAVNVTLVACGVSLRARQSLASTVRLLGPGAYWVSLLVLALLGVLIAQLLALESWLGLAVLVVPFAIARRTFRVYVETSEAYTQTVRSLVAAIEAKDPYTKGHSERVAAYARRLAVAMGVPESGVALVERAGLLHDIGKIGIHKETLTSTSPLRPQEMSEVREHPALGSQLLEDVEFLCDVVPVIRHHHERIDGLGYPDGLAGGSIPLLARILAAADAFDAMTSDRAYRPGMTSEQAEQEMLRVAGSQLDATVVAAFCDEVLPSVSGVGA